LNQKSSKGFGFLNRDCLPYFYQKYNHIYSFQTLHHKVLSKLLAQEHPSFHPKVIWFFFFLKISKILILNSPNIYRFLILEYSFLNGEVFHKFLL